MNLLVLEFECDKKKSRIKTSRSPPQHINTSNLAGTETSIFLVLKHLTSVIGIEWLIEVKTSRLLELKNEGAGVV